MTDVFGRLRDVCPVHHLSTLIYMKLDSRRQHFS